MSAPLSPSQTSTHSHTPPQSPLPPPPPPPPASITAVASPSSLSYTARFLSFTFECFRRGILQDARVRAPLYWNDWICGLDWKVLSAIVFIFFSNIFPGITFGAFLHSHTSGRVGPVEVLLSCCVTGAIYAIAAGQPLTIIGVTGPVTIFTMAVYNMATALNCDYLPLMGWICIWSGFMHILLAIYRVCELVNIVTRFSCEIFALLVGVIFIVNAIIECVDYVNSYDLSVGFFCILLCFVVFYMSVETHHARHWVLWSSNIREIIADYGVVAAIFLCTAVVYMPRFSPLFDSTSPTQSQLPCLSEFLPSSFQPATMENRQAAWLVDFSLPFPIILFAFLPALLLTALFFFDHNVSSLLAQQPHCKLVKPAAYHLDFFVLGIIVIVCGVIGVPPANGLIPQAPLHIKSLSKYLVKSDSEVECVGVVENRVSNFGQSVAIGLSLFALPLLSLIPRAVLTGFFLYMGYTSFVQNQFAQRIHFIFADKTRLQGYIANATNYKQLPQQSIAQSQTQDNAAPLPLAPYHINLFTLIQFICLCFIYLITWTPLASIFPVLILVLLPIRYYILPRWFPSKELAFLDSAEEHPEWQPDYTQEHAITQLDMDVEYAIGEHSTLISQDTTQTMQEEKEQAYIDQ